MSLKIVTLLAIGGFVRVALQSSKYALNLRDRIEISTPINSWKRVLEGAYLYSQGVNPYDGDVYHESPLFLFVSKHLISLNPNLLQWIFVALDVLTAFVLYKASKIFIKDMYTTDRENRKKYAKDVDSLLTSEEEINSIPVYVLLAYLFNPYTLLNCIGLTTTIISNFLLALFLYCLARKWQLFTCLCLALEVQKNFYSYVLIIPAAFFMHNASQHKIRSIAKCIISFVAILFGLAFLSQKVTNNWNFVDATFGFIYNHKDLQPNIGLFWYFFTEMFDHFRPLFLHTFQLNASLIYVGPLTIKMHKDPLLLTVVLMALTVIFRSYPSIGDVAFYLALLPLFKRRVTFMANSFVVFCFFVVTSLLGPVVWDMWIYSNSANANFYFGATLGFATAQIFLITELLFASIKRETCLELGLEFRDKLSLK